MSTKDFIQPLPDVEEANLALTLEGLLHQDCSFSFDAICPLLFYPHVQVRRLAYELLFRVDSDNTAYLERALQDRSRYIQGHALGILLIKWSPNRERLVSNYIKVARRSPLNIGDGPIAPEYAESLHKWVFDRDLQAFFLKKLIPLIVNTRALSKEQLRDYIRHERYAIRVPAIEAANKLGIDISDNLRDGLNHSHEGVVLSCLYGLAELSDESDVETLKQYTNHTDSRFRKAAFIGLGKMKGAAACTFLRSQVVDAIQNIVQSSELE